MRVAIVYDWIDKWGGVERLLLTLAEMFPRADFYTSYYDPESAPWARDLKIKTSFMQKLPNFIKKNRVLSLPFYPFAFESFNFKEYDLVISISSSFAKSVITRPETKHICILLTPTRYFWFNIHNWTKPFLKKYQEWDYVAAQRPDKIISISRTVQKRCKKYYKRASEVVYPPFDIEYWRSFSFRASVRNPSTRLRSLDKLGMTAGKKFYLVVSRLEPYKKVDLAIKAFNKLPKENFIVVGKGTQETWLRQIAGQNVTFVKDLSDEQLAYLYKNAQALIMPQEEDLGYVALEAQFFGCPLIAYKKGGATETVIEGKTGVFFNQQTVGSLHDIIKRFKLKRGFSTKHLEQFGKKSFVSKIGELMNNPL